MYFEAHCSKGDKKHHVSQRIVYSGAQTCNMVSVDGALQALYDQSLIQIIPLIIVTDNWLVLKDCGPQRLHRPY